MGDLETRLQFLSHILLTSFLGGWGTNANSCIATRFAFA